MSIENGQIIFDMTDLVGHLYLFSHATGIQRTQIDVFETMRATGVDVVPVFFSNVYKRYCRIDPDRLFARDLRYLRKIEFGRNRPWKRLGAAVRLWNSRVDLQSKDLVFVSGTGWGPPRRNQMLSDAQKSGVKVTWLCYDLIPLRHPEYTADAVGAYTAFKYWIDQAVRDGGSFICISEFVKNDLLAYATELGREIKCVAVPLAHEYREVEAEAVRSEVGELKHEKFVLYVSSVHNRKNQFGVVRAWQQLYDEFGDSLPTLVLVGRPWGAERLFKYLDATGYIWGKVAHLKNVSDAELTFLYRNCEFTVFPSFYEGWGLPVGESLWMGKPCLAARVTSVPEVGGNHVVYFDPYKSGELEQCLREALTNGIAVLPPPREQLRTWSDVCRDMIAAIRAVN